MPCADLKPIRLILTAFRHAHFTVLADTAHEDIDIDTDTLAVRATQSYR